MKDRELLELAAKAAGIGSVISFEAGGLVLGPNSRKRFWAPLTDDGDALRLAVSLKLDVNFYRGFQEVIIHADDMQAIVRRAIVRAAAEIGRTMP